MKMSKDVIFFLKLAMLSSLIGTMIVVFACLGAATVQFPDMPLWNVVTTLLCIFTLFLSGWGIVGLVVGFAHIVIERPRRKSRKLKNS
jgi:protein-S-isoprenylcysteine O-methyltransferase Ste14